MVHLGVAQSLNFLEIYELAPTAQIGLSKLDASFWISGTTFLDFSQNISVTIQAFDHSCVYPALTPVPKTLLRLNHFRTRT
jgi:hypothetical protein